MPNKYSYYQLRIACQQRMVASLYVEQDDPDAFNAGYVEAVTLRHVLLWMVTPWGVPDGWMLRRNEDILQVYMGDDYEVRLQMLLESQDFSFVPLFSPQTDPEDDLLFRMLALAKETNEVVSLMTDEDTFAGRVRHLDDLRVTLDLFDFFGAVEAQRPFPLRDIQMVALRTQEEAMYTRLNAERFKII